MFTLFDSTKLSLMCPDGGSDDPLTDGSLCGGGLQRGHGKGLDVKLPAAL